MKTKETAGEFLWGTADEVRARLRADVPQFRLVNPAGDLPPVQLPFAITEAGTNVQLLRQDGRVAGRVWEAEGATWCFLAGVNPADLQAARGVQASSVFKELERLLGVAGFTFGDVVRTWLYIDRVCEWYNEFNAARSAFFETRHVFEHFLPASTGIGTANLEGAALCAGAIAVKGAPATIVESPLQAPAMAYKSSFSRAAEIAAKDKTLFVSGTASILPNSSEVAYVGDVPAQIDCTMKAVRAILKSRGTDWADVTRGIVYLKAPESRVAWREWLAKNGLPIDFAAETVCDVCRDEWLFETEMDTVRNG